jgi:hypothetical protein
LISALRRQPEDDVAAAQNLRRALLTERRPMTPRNTSITIGIAILAMQAAFLIALHVIRH